MHEFIPGLSKLKPPDLHLVRQVFDETHVQDVEGAIRAEFRRPEIAAALQSARRAALAVGSRGIGGIDVIVRTLASELKGKGLDVFIVPAMGSHGGATAEGQAAMLGHMGITEQSVGAPIRSSMEVVQVGTVRSTYGNDVALYMDAIAHGQADLVIPVVRIKPHTGFKGPVESGICKMLSIGLAKHVGCARMHREGMGVFDHLIPTAGEAILATGKIGPSVSVLENAYEQTAHVEAVPAANAIARERELLVTAKRLLARLLMPHIDVLVVEEFGKNISGIGMDPNITGRAELGGAMPGFDGPVIRRIVVLGLTEKTSGNAHGIGQADIVTQSVFDGIDRRTSWTNTLTAGSLDCGKLPIALPTEAQAIMAAASCLPGVAAEDAKIVRIRNTLRLTEIAVSQTMLGDIADTPDCEAVGPWNGRWS